MTAFKADENLPIEAAAMLRDAGFDVTTVIEQELGGHPDPDVANVCRAERRALLTLDVDFANIDAYPPSQHSGIVVFRLGRQDKRHILAVLRNLIAHLTDVELTGRASPGRERRRDRDAPSGCVEVGSTAARASGTRRRSARGRRTRCLGGRG